MGTRDLFMLKANLHELDRAFLLEFLYKNMFRFLGSVCVLLWNFLFFIFGSIIRYFFRVQADEKSEPNSQSQQIKIGSCDDGIGKEQKSEVGFAFHGGTGGEDEDGDHESNAESEDSVVSAPAIASTTTSKYQFVSGRGISGFVEEPKIMSLKVQELYVNDQIHDPKFSQGCNFEETEDSVHDEEKETEDSVHDEEKEAEDSVLTFSFGRLMEITEKVVPENEDDENNLLGNHNNISDQDQYSENHVCPIDSEPKPISSGTSEFLLDERVCEDLGKKVDDTDDISPEPEPIDIRDQAHDSDDEEYIEFDPHLQNSSMLDLEERAVSDLDNVDEAVGYEETEEMNGSEKSEKPSSEDSEDDVGWEFISEHKDLIEQLKMELKNVRAGGLPTILEESESPKIVEDLKPLKIDHKFEHKDRIEQIQKVYKSYAEKMRKLDILNYQTMHAIGLLQRKDPSLLILGRKSSSGSALKLPFLRVCKTRTLEDDDPMGELQRDLELVYVGQVCLSWEILYWQYGKARELKEHDPQGFRQYNQVAGEFQLFQVLVQRYVEDETFQGPRVQNYVKNRFILRNLLQVPVIRDDKKGRIGEGEDTVSSATLTEIIQESMRVFWEFLRTDKDGTNVISKQTQIIDLQNPADAELLMEVRADLHKKERKLKEIARSGTCIVNKFRKHQENQLDHTLFLAQVELRLVSRVLNMSKLTTHQLVWCHEQLGKINFVNRKVHLEQSFLLFP